MWVYVTDWILRLTFKFGYFASVQWWCKNLIILKFSLFFITTTATAWLLCFKRTNDRTNDTYHPILFFGIIPWSNGNLLFQKIFNRRTNGEFVNLICKYTAYNCQIQLKKKFNRFSLMFLYSDIAIHYNKTLNTKTNQITFSIKPRKKNKFCSIKTQFIWSK